MGERAHGLRLVFDPALDGGGWPGPLAGRDACIGEQWVGPRGLLDRFETELGLGRIWPRAAERSARLAHNLQELDGPWSVSYEADPLGTAQRLLADRDALWLWGWRGQPVSDRLSALAKATADALPGLPDRLQSIASALDARRPDIEEISICSPVDLLPTRWRVIFQELEELGIRLVQQAIQPARASGDLSRARTASFSPVGDGSVSLLRSHGPLATADEIAGCLAAMDRLDGVLVVGADSVLVNAFEHKGLPRPLTAGRATASQAALRLAIEAMFRPADPELLYAFLSLNPGPIPAGIASRLIGALAQLPGRGSPRWQEALLGGLERVDEDRRERVRDRVEGLLEPAADRGDSVPVAAVISRMRLLSTWARGVAESVPDVLGVAFCAEAFCNVLDGLPFDRFTRIELQRLIDELDMPGADGGSAEAGLASVPHPGAVLGPARIVVWWGFTRDHAKRPPRLRLSENERAALEALGVTPPNPGAVAKAEAMRWRRPLEQATESLILACPRTTDSGERAFPHPLWDELTAAMGGGNAAAKLTAPRLRLPAEPTRRSATLQILPVPQVQWRTKAPIPLRPRGESPSSLEMLLGCSLAWTLHYHGWIRRRYGPPAPPGPLLYGQMAHHVLANVFEAGPVPATDAHARAEEVFEASLPELCETLLLPRFQVERAELKRAVVLSAQELARLMEETGAQVRGVELYLEQSLPDLSLGGVADLVLTDPEVVIDLKWGRTTNRGKMASGTALQLAAYAELAKTSVRPEVAYFILRTQELFAEPGSTLPHAESPGEHFSIDTWRGAMAALADAKHALANRTLSARGADGSQIESARSDDGLTIGPGCYFCGLSAICGRGGAR